MPVSRILRSIALLLLGSVAAGCGFEPKRWEVPTGGTDVPLSLDENQPGVDVMFNGRGPFHVLVDTGASPAIAVSPKLARALGLRRHLGYVRLRAANGRWVRGGRTRLRSVRLGDAIFQDVPAVILNVGAPDFDAVIGMGLLSRGVVTFDFPSRRLSLRAGKLDGADPDVFATEFVYGVPLVPVSPPLEGDPRAVRVLLDTGSNTGLILPASLRDKLKTHPGVGGRAVADTLGGERTIDLVKLRGGLKLGRYTATDPVVGIARGRGAVGTSALLHFEVGIDQRSSRVRLKLVGTAAHPAAPPSTAPMTRPATPPAAAAR